MTTDRVRLTTVPASATNRSPGISDSAGDGPEAAAHRGEVLTLMAMCMGAAVTFLLITATVSALPSIQDGLHVSPSNLIWIPSTYTLIVASLVLPSGTMGNRFGRKRMFCIGLMVMIVGGLGLVMN
ncbi:MFS transporter [Rhodococcus sp. WS4]|nr:MFS transporter [Rhodococcus sp. WS4]